MYFVYHVSPQPAHCRKLILLLVFFFAVCHIVQHTVKVLFAVSVAFAVFIVGTRQSFSLPCAQYNAHGKSLGTRQISRFPAVSTALKEKGKKMQASTPC